MKKKFFTMLSLAVLITCFAAVPAQALLADFNVLDSYIEIGESFAVEVSVYDDGTLGDLSSFGFDVDPLASLSLFSYDSYTVAPDFWDTGSGGNNVGGVYLGSDNAGKDVLLATLSFTALTAGTDTLSIEGLFDGIDHGLYYWLGNEDITGSIDITSHPGGAPVPEPATMLLLGTGLVGLAGFRKKFKS